MTLDERTEEYLNKETTITTKEVPYDNWSYQTVDIENEVKKAFQDGFIQGEESKDAHWHTPEEIPTNEEGKSYTVNVLNNHHQIVYYDFCNNCWIDDNSCCDADEFQAWCYLPEYKG